MARTIDHELLSIKRIIQILNEFSREDQSRILSYIIGRFEKYSIPNPDSIDVEKDDSHLDLLTKQVIEAA